MSDFSFNLNRDPLDSRNIGCYIRLYNGIALGGRCDQIHGKLPSRLHSTRPPSLLDIDIFNSATARSKISHLKSYTSWSQLLETTSTCRNCPGKGCSAQSRQISPAKSTINNMGANRGQRQSMGRSVTPNHRPKSDWFFKYDPSS